MIDIAVKYVQSALNAYFGASPDVVVLGNISFAKDGSAEAAAMEKCVVLSLINVEEDRISKEPQPYRYDGSNIFQQQPIVYLNLYLLFSANHNDYPTALNYLTKVITFFQHNSFLSADNDTGFPGGIEKLVFDLYSIGLDQVHHVWSMLGGKYFPSVIYKMRVVPVFQPERGVAGVVQKIRTNENLF